MLSMINYDLVQSNKYYPMSNPNFNIGRNIGVKYLTNRMKVEIKALQDNLFGPLPIFGIYNVKKGWSEIADADLNDVIDLLCVCRILLQKNDTNFSGLINFSRLWNKYCLNLSQNYLNKYGSYDSQLFINCSMYSFNEVYLINPDKENMTIYNNLADYPNEDQNIVILNWDLNYITEMIERNTLLSVLLMSIRWINSQKKGFSHLILPSLYSADFNGILTRSELLKIFSLDYDFPSKGLMKKISYYPIHINNYRLSRMYTHDSVVFNNFVYEKDNLAEIPLTLGSLKIEESIYDQLFKKLNNLTILYPNKESMSKFILLKSRILYSISSGMPFKLLNTTFTYSNHDNLRIKDINLFFSEISGHNEANIQIMCSPNSNEDLTFLFLIFFTLSDSPNKMISELFTYYPVQVTKDFILNLDFLKISYNKSIIVSYIVKCACLIMLFRLYEGLENLNRNYYCREDVFINNQFYNYNFDLQDYVFDTIYIGEIMKIYYNSHIKSEYIEKLMNRNYEIELTHDQVEHDLNYVLRNNSPKILKRRRDILLTKDHILQLILINKRTRFNSYIFRKLNLNVDLFDDIFMINDRILVYLKTRTDENMYLMMKHLTYKFCLSDQYSCIHRLKLDPSVKQEGFFSSLNEAEPYLLNLFWNCIVNQETYLLGPKLYISIMKNILFNKYDSTDNLVWNPETISKKYGYNFILD